MGCGWVISFDLDEVVVNDRFFLIWMREFMRAGLGKDRDVFVYWDMRTGFFESTYREGDLG